MSWRALLKATAGNARARGMDVEKLLILEPKEDLRRKTLRRGGR